jgi:pimeloyl-ACP methyl ester carboxylesterase
MELGAGPALLLVHGGLASGFYWAPILPAFAENHRVLVVDLPGHGLADPFDYTGIDPLDHARTFLGDILAALELRTVAIVANSLGGLWSVAFALDAPDRVSRLVLVGAAAGVARGVPLQLRMLASPFVGQTLGRRLLSNQSRESTRAFWGQLLVVHPERLDNTLLDADIAHSRRNLESMLSLVHCVANLMGLRDQLILGDRWQDLKTPTLFLCGDRDGFMSPNVWRAWMTIATRNSNLRITHVPDAGHLPWLDDPQRIVNEIERFLTM